jgi:hypothetical protein
VEPILAPGEVSASDLLRQARPFRVGEAESIGDGLESIGVVAAVEIDPQELAVTKIRNVDIGQVDQSVMPVCVEQPGRGGTQLTWASRSAATTATTAVRYWRTSIARSDGAASSRPRNGWGVLSVSIDLGSSFVDLVQPPCRIACSRDRLCADTATRRPGITRA